MREVTMYTTNFCSYCRAAKQFLTTVKGATVKEIDLSDDPAARVQLAERTGQKTVPQIFVGTVHIGGYTDMRALDAAGGLDPLLAD